MASRSSSRIQSKPKVDYTADTNDLTDEPLKKTRKKRSAKSNNSTVSVAKNAKAKISDANKGAGDTASDSPKAKPSRGKRKAKSPDPVPEDMEIVAKKTKIEEKIDAKIKEEKSGKSIVPVDVFCPIQSSSAVVCDEDGPWDAMLNQTNVGSNNNKYYLLQLLKDSKTAYYTWFRWGRIGYSNSHQNSLNTFSNIEDAKSSFTKKFKEKTKNIWPTTFDDFEKYGGSYDLIKLDYTIEEEKKSDDATAVKLEPVESKLHPSVLSLMQLISDVKTMETAVMNMNYDVKKSPLGKLSKEQIKSGYEALTILEECIKAGQLNTKKSRDACSMFYTRIPHSFGFQSPPMITTMEQVKLKMDLLDILIDIEAAVKAIKQNTNDNVHKSDSFYHNLKIEMTPLEKDSDLFKMLSSYLQNTHGKTHAHYSLEVEDIFELDKEGETDRFSDLGNKQLLWHGSRLTNWGGIFSQGLRIAPPEAPVTGYMFGKGVYFADMVSKSANYCFASRNQPTGILLLAEVSLGEERELLNSDYRADKLPKGKHSTKGVGSTCPDPSKTEYIVDVKVPMGTSVETEIGKTNGFALQYNEYIVYDVKQIKMKYALRVKFNYDR